MSRAVPGSPTSRILGAVSLPKLIGLTIILGLVSCGDGGGRVLTVEAVGRVTGVVYTDLTGDSARTNGDVPAEGMIVGLAYAGGGPIIQTAVTDELGQFEMTDVPVGALEIRLDPTFLGDSLKIVEVDPPSFTLAAADSVEVVAGIGFSSYPIVDARALPVGTPLFTLGMALTPRMAFDGGTVFLRGAGRAIRVTRFPLVDVSPGDSIRIRGHVASDLGQPIMRADAMILLSEGGTPTASSVSTSVAAQARNGELDADLVQVAAAVVRAIAVVDGDLVATANDGTGPVMIRLRAEIAFPLAAIRPDSSVFATARGVLKPLGPGQDGLPRWELLPRFPSDVLVTPVQGGG